MKYKYVKDGKRFDYVADLEHVYICHDESVYNIYYIGTCIKQL